MLTVASILTTTALFSLAMVLVLGSLLRSPVEGVREWFFANLAMVVSLPLLGLRDAIPDFISIVLGNVVLSLAGLLYYAGCARFLGRPVPWRRLTAGVLLVGIAMAIWRYGYNSVPLRVVASTAYSSTICIAIGMILLRHRPRERSPYNFWFAGTLAFVFAATQMVRGMYFLLVPPVDATIMFSNIWNIGLLTVGAVIMPTMTMVAVMMVHDAMLAKVEDAANHDHLTGALSRRRFENVAKNFLGQVSAAQPLSLLLIDLDHFKRINDSCGHAGGDEGAPSCAWRVHWRVPAMRWDGWEVKNSVCCCPPRRPRKRPASRKTCAVKRNNTAWSATSASSACAATASASVSPPPSTGKA